MIKGYEFHNSDGCTCCGMQEHESHMNLGADYVLASDYAALEARLAEVRMNTGCARGQRSTQFCAEVVARDKIITKLLEMLKPRPELISCAQVDFQASFELEVTGNFYARACEIAGRTE